MGELAVYTLLINAPAVTAIVGTRVFPVRVSQSAAYPYIRYMRAAGARWRSTQGPSGKAQPLIQVDCYAATYAEVKTLANAVRQTLDGYRGTVAGVRVGSISLETDEDMEEDGPEPIPYRVSMDFLVTHEEA